jgi:hypothetical protein
MGSVTIAAVFAISFGYLRCLWSINNTNHFEFICILLPEYTLTYFFFGEENA